jgi:hypothetical protein
MQSYDDLEIAVAEEKSEYVYSSRCAGAGFFATVNVSHIQSVEQGFLMDNEVIKHVMVRPDGETIHAIG